MKTHASHKDDDNSSENEKSDTEDERSITTENSSEEKIDTWTTLINNAVSKVREQYYNILQNLPTEGHDES